MPRWNYSKISQLLRLQSVARRNVNWGMSYESPHFGVTFPNEENVAGSMSCSTPAAVVVAASTRWEA